MDRIKCTAQGESWRAFRHQNGKTLVRCLRVTSGEWIAHAPLDVALNKDALAQGQEWGHALVTALATLDVDQMMESIQSHDPLSWHCHCYQTMPAVQCNGCFPGPLRNPSPNPTQIPVLTTTWICSRSSRI